MKDKNITTKSIVKLMLSIIAIFSLVSCEEVDEQYYNYDQIVTPFNGSVLQYLESQPGVYDSMLVVIDQVPGLRDSLSREGVTIFAVTNDSFRTVVNELNSFRKSEKLEPVYLKDLNSANLDTLMSRYVFRGKFDSGRIKPNTNGVQLTSIKFGYTMHAEFSEGYSSGYVKGGPQLLAFSDPNNSVLRSNWVQTQTKAMDQEAANGIVHTLTPGHNFGFNDFIFRFTN